MPKDRPLRRWATIAVVFLGVAGLVALAVPAQRAWVVRRRDEALIATLDHADADVRGSAALSLVAMAIEATDDARRERIRTALRDAWRSHGDARLAFALAAAGGPPDRLAVDVEMLAGWLARHAGAVVASGGLEPLRATRSAPLAFGPIDWIKSDIVAGIEISLELRGAGGFVAVPAERVGRRATVAVERRVEGARLIEMSDDSHVYQLDVPDLPPGEYDARLSIALVGPGPDRAPIALAARDAARLRAPVGKVTVLPKGE